MNPAAVHPSVGNYPPYPAYIQPVHHPAAALAEADDSVTLSKEKLYQSGKNLSLGTGLLLGIDFVTGFLLRKKNRVGSMDIIDKLNWHVLRPGNTAFLGAGILMMMLGKSKTGDWLSSVLNLQELQGK